MRQWLATTDKLHPACRITGASHDFSPVDMFQKKGLNQQLLAKQVFNWKMLCSDGSAGSAASATQLVPTFTALAWVLSLSSGDAGPANFGNLILLARGYAS